MAALVFIKLSPMILVLMGLLSSILWLLFYLREDCHPEPKRLVLKIFGWGMLVAPLAIVLQYLFLGLWNAYLGPSSLWRALGELFTRAGTAPMTGETIATLAHLLVLAGIEEYLKYLVVKTEVMDDPEFNEPVDAVEYLIIAALGFAAAENVLIAFTSLPAPTAVTAVGQAASEIFGASRVLGARFFGATLLHAFSSAILGYFLAVKLSRLKPWALPAGLALATGLHALFNYFILVQSGLTTAGVLASAALMLGFTLWLIRRARRLSALHRLPATRS